MVSALIYGAVQSALFLLLAVYAASMNFHNFRNINCNLFACCIRSNITMANWKAFRYFCSRKSNYLFNFGAAFFAICAIFASRQMYLPDGLATSKTWFYVCVNFFFFFKFTYVCNHSCIY